MFYVLVALDLLFYIGFVAFGCFYKYRLANELDVEPSDS
jgi:hypothetical protein